MSQPNDLAFTPWRRKSAPSVPSQAMVRVSPDKVRELAFALTKGALALVAPQLAVAQSIVELVEIASRPSDDRREQRTIHHLLDHLVGDITDKLSDYDLELSKLDLGERAQAIEGLEAAARSIQVDYLELARQQYDSEVVLRQFMPKCTAEWQRRGLSREGHAYGTKLLRASASSFAAYVRPLPMTDRDITIRALLLADDAPQRFLESLRQEILPHARRGTSEEVTDFDAAYLTSIGRLFGSIKLFGMHDVPEAMRQQPLDVSYISLTTTEAASPSELREASFRPANDRTHDLPRPPMPVEQTLNELAARSVRSRRGVRVMIAGGAGSGKTTVARWLATTCAQSAASASPMPSSVQRWSGRIPVIVAMRDLFNGSRQTSTPTDLDLLASVRVRIPEPPGAWVQGILTDRPAVLIFDGLDEVPPALRHTALDWIAGLADRYPHNWIVLSSRPEALDRKWLGEQGYSLLELQPLTIGQMRQCIGRWFRALRIANPRLAEVYGDRQRRLVDDIVRRPSVRDLAETPLLTAILCAYYAATADDSPVNRLDLILSVTKVLIDKRERERGLIPAEFLKFGETAKLSILGAIAYEMYEAGQSQIRIHHLEQGTRSASLRGPMPEPAGTICGDALSTMPSLGLDPERTLTYLLERSFLFMEVSANEAQFAHRLFLEYLAAHHIWQQGIASTIATNTALPGWSAVATFYCALAPQHQAASFMASLVALIHATPDTVERRRLTYCLIGCSAAKVSYPSEILDELGHLLRSCMPPATHDEIVLLSGVGDALIPLLDTPSNPTEAAAYISAMSRIRSAGALDQLSSYSRGPFSAAIRHDLVEAWDSFAAADEYADRVLSNLDLRDVTVHVRTRDCLNALNRVWSIRKVAIADVGPLADLSSLQACPELTNIDLTECTAVGSLAGLEGFSSLRRIWLPRTYVTQDISPLLDNSTLRELHVFGAAWMANPAVLGSLPNLAVLYLELATQSAIERANLASTRLQMLTVDRSDISSLDFLRGLTDLRALRVRSDTGIINSSALADLHLERLSLHLSPGRPVLALPRSDCLLSLRLSGYVDVDDLAEGISRHSRLKELLVSGGVDQMPDLRILAHNRSLRRLVLGGTGDLSTIAGIDSLPALCELSISWSNLESLSGAMLRIIFDNGKALTAIAEEDATFDEWRPGSSIGGRKIVKSEVISRWSLAGCRALETVEFSHSPRLSSVMELLALGSLRTARLADVGQPIDAETIEAEISALQTKGVSVLYFPMIDGQAVS